MARTKIPTALAMRTLKYGDADEATRDQVAEALREAGRRAEALLLFEGRPEHPFLREEARWAVAEGEGFHLLSIRRLGAAVEDAELRDCAKAAESRGRFMEARNCYVALGDEEAIAKIAEHLPASLRPDAPRGADS